MAHQSARRAGRHHRRPARFISRPARSIARPLFPLDFPSHVVHGRIHPCRCVEALGMSLPSLIPASPLGDLNEAASMTADGGIRRPFRGDAGAIAVVPATAPAKDFGRNGDNFPASAIPPPAGAVRAFPREIE